MSLPSPAMYEERLRLQAETGGELIIMLRCAFADAMLALEEIDRKEIADRLRTRWPEAGTPGAVTPEDVQTTKGSGTSSVGQSHSS